MNSEVIKFVAGGGKTTFSLNYLKENENGIYLAFTNSVVDAVRNKGFLSKTIDSFFSNYIFPKFTSVIPLISNEAKIKFVDTNELPISLRGIANIHIANDGEIYNHKKKTIIDLTIKNEKLHQMNYFPNSSSIKYIFGKKELRLTDKLRAELAIYLMKNYKEEIIHLIKSRFSYVIIDEAQDLNNHRENFAKLLYESDIKLILLGDDNQNINGGGVWFESLVATQVKNISYRCPENNCKWIRDNLNINIYGNSNNSEFVFIKHDDISKYDDGNKTLLYSQKSGINIETINSWKGQAKTIKTAKGSTIENDIVIIGKTLNTKNFYTAITRTKKNVYTTITKVKE